MSKQNVFSGFAIIEDPMMIEQYEDEVARSVYERLFTLPWRPFKKRKKVIESRPSDSIIRHGNCLVVHPELAIKIKECGDL